MKKRKFAGTHSQTTATITDLSSSSIRASRLELHGFRLAGYDAYVCGGKKGKNRPVKKKYAFEKFKVADQITNG